MQAALKGEHPADEAQKVEMGARIAEALVALPQQRIGILEAKREQESRPTGHQRGGYY